jgi:hypothetical protein
MEDLADVRPACDDLGACRVEVGDDQVQTLDGARRLIILSGMTPEPVPGATGMRSQYEDRVPGR